MKNKMETLISKSAIETFNDNGRLTRWASNDNTSTITYEYNDINKISHMECNMNNTHMGIDYEYDSYGNMCHSKNTDSEEEWYEYDKDGIVSWHDSKGNSKKYREIHV